MRVGRLFVNTIVLCLCAEFPLIECVQMRDNKWTSRGEYRPRCTENGDYAPMQCHEGTGECWCAYPDGREVPGTKIWDSRPPDCSRYGSCGLFTSFTDFSRHSSPCCCYPYHAYCAVVLNIGVASKVNNKLLFLTRFSLNFPDFWSISWHFPDFSQQMSGNWSKVWEIQGKSCQGKQFIVNFWGDTSV